MAGSGSRQLGGEDTPPLQSGRLLFVNQYYWPDHASTAQHLADLVESLAADGYECHVLCGQGGYKPGTPRPPAFEVHNGVQIHRVPTTSLGRRSTLTRMIDYLSFYARAMASGLTMPRFDVVVTLSTPPIIGLIGTLLRRFKGTRHVYWSMDLHPDASLALGRMSRRNPIVAALAALSDLVYRQADTVVVLGPYMADRIAAKRVHRDRLVTVPVWSRREEIYPMPRFGHPLRAELGLSDKFVAMYSGNLGLAHSFEEFLGAARRLRECSNIVFLFVGAGPRLVEVRSAKETEGLDNIRLLDYFPREQLHASLSIADVHLISMRREMTGIVVPGKLYGAMASGRPAIFVGPEHSESADTIREAGCGLTLRLGDVDGLVDALSGLASDPDRADRMGQLARAAFLDSHERATCCARWNEVIRDLIPTPQPAHDPRPVAAQVAGGSA
ncbi:Glycosyltransferase involved in cell wall bisynthesis [Singulisphaera sp. GP187]|uniref:glycosyltransferase family 4 protein n=1 Tax=Singulisphaera sp. GP187 TaxID=1882752 RepID=UPI00092764A3|nr:glycosyltransferase family 4 protein [Singulisphaera sp. GP187]SIO08283.1 Glycosyltransferase involved in cell wall bisynthesis [Singulisphaera sp. GP187]